MQLDDKSLTKLLKNNRLGVTEYFRFVRKATGNQRSRAIGVANGSRLPVPCRYSRYLDVHEKDSRAQTGGAPTMAKMTKADIIEAVYEKVGGFSKKEAAQIVETVFDSIKETLELGEKIKISGFGNFVVREKKARIGRNPQTGEEITISARRVLTFKPSQVLKNALNGQPIP